MFSVNPKGRNSDLISTGISIPSFDKKRHRSITTKHIKDYLIVVQETDEITLVETAKIVPLKDTF